MSSKTVAGDTSIPESQGLTRTIGSPHNESSEPDVTAFADAMVQRMERNQSHTQDEASALSLASAREFLEQAQATLGAQSSPLQRSSAPICIREGAHSSNSALESVLLEGKATGFQMSELLPASHLAPETTIASGLQTDDDSESSVYGPPWQ